MVDTNVLIAASAAVPSSRAAAFATPDDPDLRLRVWNWLSDFDEAEEHVFRWEATHNPDQIRGLFSTFSPWIALPVERREPLLDALHALATNEFAGRVVRPYRTVIQLRRRTAR